MSIMQNYIIIVVEEEKNSLPNKIIAIYNLRLGILQPLYFYEFVC